MCSFQARDFPWRFELPSAIFPMLMLTSGVYQPSPRDLHASNLHVKIFTLIYTVLLQYSASFNVWSPRLIRKCRSSRAEIADFVSSPRWSVVFFTLQSRRRESLLTDPGMNEINNFTALNGGGNTQHSTRRAEKKDTQQSLLHAATGWKFRVSRSPRRKKKNRISPRW